MDLLQRANELRSRAAGRRPALAVAGLVAIVCGLLVFLRPGLPPEPRQYEVWLAEGQLLVDTSDSQVIDARAIGIETLAVRAILLGNLIATSPLRDGIAERAGVDPDDLAVTPPASTVPEAPPPPAVASEAPDAEATKLSVSTDPSLPIVRVVAQAPSATTATGLADAALAEVSAYVDSARAGRALPDQRRLVVSALGSATARSETRGPGFSAALVVVLLVALLGGGLVLALPIGRGGAAPAPKQAAANGHAPAATPKVKRAVAKKPSSTTRRAKKSTARKPRAPR